jgi:4-hydroxybenzoate polyprenyltransferase
MLARGNGRRGLAMGEMSKAVETVYGVLFDEMKFAKRQQWTVTNFMLLLLGAIFGIGVALRSITPVEKHVLWLLEVFVVGAGAYFVIDLQRYMQDLRERIQSIEASFDEADRILLDVRGYKLPGLRSLPFTVMMLTAITVAAIVVGYALWRL